MSREGGGEGAKKGRGRIGKERKMVGRIGVIRGGVEEKGKRGDYYKERRRKEEIKEERYEELRKYKESQEEEEETNKGEWKHVDERE